MVSQLPPNIPDIFVFYAEVRVFSLCGDSEAVDVCVSELMNRLLSKAKLTRTFSDLIPKSESLK